MFFITSENNSASVNEKLTQNFKNSFLENIHQKHGNSGFILNEKEVFINGVEYSNINDNILSGKYEINTENCESAQPCFEGIFSYDLKSNKFSFGSLNKNSENSENNFNLFSNKIIKSNKDVSEIKKWLNIISKNENDGDESYITSSCLSYIKDVINFQWNYDENSLSENELNKKWSSKYDLKHATFGHIFESGNCGWGSKKIVENIYLGEYNDGSWFKLIIKGGCLENDYSETLIRVVKVIEKNNNYYIDNFLNLSKE